MILKDSEVYGQEAIAKHFKVTSRTIQSWQRKGLPHRGRVYDKVECEIWRRRQEEAGAVAESEGSAGAEDTKAHWSKRETQARAQLKELELKKRGGELVPLADIEKMFINRIMAVKQGLLSLARSLPPSLVGKDERGMEATINRSVKHLLTEFSRQATIKGPRPYDREVLHQFLDELLDDWEKVA